MKKRVLAILLAGIMGTGLVACNKKGSAEVTDPGTSPAESSKGYNISVVLKTTSAEYWQYVLKGAEAYMADHPEVSVKVKGPSSETAYDEQQNMIETDLNNSEVDALILAPCQSETAATLVKGTNKVVLAVDTDFDAPEKLAFVGTGNEAAAKLGGKAAVEAAKAAGWEEIKAIEIAGVQGDTTNEARMKGYMAGVEEAGGDFLENEIQYANAVADQAVTCMEAIMQTHPEGIAIICTHNDDLAMAAARAAAGNEAYKNTIFLGFNGDRPACEAILDGKLTMSVAQGAYEMGYAAVEAAVAALDGETLDAFIDSGADVVTAENAQTRLDTLLSYLG